MALSGVAMAAAAFGWLTPVAGALTQEAIDVAVILNALRALVPARAQSARRPMPPATRDALHQEHEQLDADLDRLREIADALDDADAGRRRRPDRARPNGIVAREIVVARARRRDQGLSAARQVPRRRPRPRRHEPRPSRDPCISRGCSPGSPTDLSAADADRYLVRDAQRVIESIEALVRIHNAQEEDIYEHAATG